MKKRRSRSPAEASDTKQLEMLRAYMAKVAKGTLHRHNMYSLCVKASAAKCFEFNLAVRDLAKSDNAFFGMSTLRGICEDLIVLRYIGQMPSDDRERLVRALSAHALATRVKLQDAFFATLRPQQPVLRFKDVDAAIGSSALAARSIWNRHVWPHMTKGAMPRIREIAQKQGLHYLIILYDYLYRLTSAGGHFNLESLLRSRWGLT